MTPARMMQTQGRPQPAGSEPVARLFVALALPEAAVDALMALQSGPRGARWVAADNFHLTLAFVGEADRRVAEDIDAGLSGVKAPAFPLTLSGCGVFGGRRPHALWAGVAPSPALERLQERVETALRRAGCIIAARRFTPHVTLAYTKGVGPEDAAAWVRAHNLFAFGPFPVEAFHLYESTRLAGGVVYDALADYPLSSSM